MDPDRIPLACLPRELASAGHPGVSYRTIYARCLDGLFPAERGRGGWTVARAEIPAVVAACAPAQRAAA
jgi:hypothetical protein